eukprot:gene1469-biopygen7327
MGGGPAILRRKPDHWTPGHYTEGAELPLELPSSDDTARRGLCGYTTTPMSSVSSFSFPRCRVDLLLFRDAVALCVPPPAATRCRLVLLQRLATCKAGCHPPVPSRPAARLFHKRLDLIVGVRLGRVLRLPAQHLLLEVGQVEAVRVGAAPAPAPAPPAAASPLSSPCVTLSSDGLLGWHSSDAEPRADRGLSGPRLVAPSLIRQPAALLPAPSAAVCPTPPPRPAPAPVV